MRRTKRQRKSTKRKQRAKEEDDGEEEEEGSKGEESSNTLAEVPASTESATRRCVYGDLVWRSVKGENERMKERKKGKNEQPGERKKKSIAR